MRKMIKVHKEYVEQTSIGGSIYIPVETINGKKCKAFTWNSWDNISYVFHDFYNGNAFCGEFIIHRLNGKTLIVRKDCRTRKVRKRIVKTPKYVGKLKYCIEMNR